MKVLYRYKDFNKECASFIFIYYENNEKGKKLDEDQDIVQ